VKAESERRLRHMFDALEVSLDLVRSLRRPLARIRVRDRSLSEQIRRAASSIPLNLAEGRRRLGGDRAHSWRIAAGSAEELRAALRVALAWGDVEDEDVSNALELIDRVLAMLWRMTR
jgi:four helix bundle protein